MITKAELLAARDRFDRASQEFEAAQRAANRHLETAGTDSSVTPDEFEQHAKRLRDLVHEAGEAARQAGASYSTAIEMYEAAAIVRDNEKGAAAE